MRVGTVSILICLAWSRGSLAQTIPVSSKCVSPEYRQLDFWVGDWDAFDSGGSTPVARTRVDVLLGGCVLHEVYDGADGHRGESFTIYDSSRKVWHQSWVTNRGELLVIEGSARNGEIVLSGKDLSRTGTERQVQGTWKPVPGGVRESAAISTDDGKTWNSWFDLVFRPHVSNMPVLDSHASVHQFTSQEDLVVTDERTLRDLNNEYIRAFMTGDVPWYQQHLSEDFVCIEYDGSVLKKPEFLAQAGLGPDVAEYKLDKVDVRIYGDVSLVQATGLFRRKDGSLGTSRYIDVYVRKPDGWKAVSAQVTRAPHASS